MNPHPDAADTGPAPTGPGGVRQDDLVPVTTAVRPARRWASGNLALDAAGILVLAFAVRFGVVLFSNGGPGGIYGYDSGVYYAAADALTHGRVPYRDFVFLHPPGLMLVLTPFAALGRLTSDHVGFITANASFNLLAAVNAVLVHRIALRWGFTRRAALLGGLFYAIWWGGINAEIGVRLEPLGTFAFLAGIFLLAGHERPSGRRAAAAGAVLAAACCVKIWWALPLLIVLGYHLRGRASRRPAAFLAAGAVAGAAVITGPFLALAGTDMWNRVVTDQLGRRYHTQPFVRIQFLAGLRKAFPGLPTVLVAVAAVMIAAVLVATVVVAWRIRAARVVIAVLVAQVLVLLAAPSFFNFYSGFLAGALALTVAAAAQAPGGRLSGPRTATVAAVTAGIVSMAGLAHSRDLVDPFPAGRFEQATADLRCVMTDSPSVLIVMNRLSRDLADDCPNWVDVTGHTYFGPASSDDLTRPKNPRWQADLRRYLLSGQAVVIIRPGTGYSGATLREITSLPVLDRAGGYAIYAVPPGR